MTWIKAPQDDYAVREIQRKNSTATAIGQPGTVQQPEKKDLLQRDSVPVRQPTQEQERRKTDRRRKERRVRQEAVVLDTRTYHDRRRNDRRREPESWIPPKGVDRFA